MEEQAQLKEQLREMTIFYQIAALIEKDPRVDQILAGILRIATFSLDVEKGAVLLIDQGSAATLFLPVGGAPKAVDVRTPLEVCDDLSSLVGPFSLYGPLLDWAQGVLALPGGEGLDLLALPLFGKFGVLGFLLLVRPREVGFFEDLRFLSAIADQSARGIEQVRLLARMIELPNTDPLTRVLNRRGFEHSLDQVFSATDGDSAPFSLVLIDVDHFKKINDIYGHATGDRVLKEVATIISDSVCKTDIVCRLGGEEFAILLSHCAPEAAGALTEGIREKIEQRKFHLFGESFSVTISAGISSTRDELVKGSNDLYIFADEALYEAKRGGRNRVWFRKEKVNTPFRTGAPPRERFEGRLLRADPLLSVLNA